MAFRGNTLFETLDLLDELRNILRNPQYNLNFNAQFWLEQATAESLPVETLAGYIEANANSFEAQMTKVKEARTDPAKWNRLLDLIVRLGGAEKDLNDIILPNDEEVAKLRAAPKATYNDIKILSVRIIGEIKIPPRIEDKPAPVIRTR